MRQRQRSSCAPTVCAGESASNVTYQICGAGAGNTEVWDGERGRRRAEQSESDRPSTVVRHCDCDSDHRVRRQCAPARGRPMPRTRSAELARETRRSGTRETESRAERVRSTVERRETLRQRQRSPCAPTVCAGESRVQGHVPGLRSWRRKRGLARERGRRRAEHSESCQPPTVVRQTATAIAMCADSVRRRERAQGHVPGLRSWRGKHVRNNPTADYPVCIYLRSVLVWG